MTDVDTVEEEEPKKKSKLPLILGVVLAVVGGAGGFLAVSMGIILAPEVPEEVAQAGESADAPAPEAAPVSDVAFVPLDPIVVSLPQGGATRLLRFRAQLEVSQTASEEVTLLMPRVIDVLNGYLRAVSLAELEDPAALARMRGQMLRRAQVVTGPDKVRDLLIMEFVLN